MALSALSGIPAVSQAAQPVRAPKLHVAVKPRSGSPATRFVISFKPAPSVSKIGLVHASFRVTASDRGRAGCRSSTSATVLPARVGETVHVALAPGSPQRWCAGTFRGQVWEVLIQPCPLAQACPAIVPLPVLVGKFTFRVARG